jgi:hypothetical protein
MVLPNISEFDPRALCFFIGRVGDYVSEQAFAARTNEGLRDELIQRVVDTRELKLGTAIRQEIPEAELTDELVLALDQLPDPLRHELADATIGVLRDGLEFEVELLYSTDGSISTEVSTLYRGSQYPDGNDDTRQVRSLRLICPPLRPPAPSP